jgi:hypothetical protein
LQNFEAEAMTKRYPYFLVFILVAIFTTNLHAQARFAIYGTAGTERSGLPNTTWKLGGTFGFYLGLLHAGPIDISADARGDLSTNVNSGFLGPRVAVKIPVIPIKPYAEFIFGIATYPSTSRGISPENEFADRYVVGVDTTIIPHIDWRMVDYSHGVNRSANGDHAETITTGLVIRF